MLPGSGHGGAQGQKNHANFAECQTPCVLDRAPALWPPAGDQGTAAPGRQQADRAGHLRLRCDLVHRLCHRRNPGHPEHGRGERRRAEPVGAHCRGDRHPVDHRDGLLPPDDLHLSPGRRGLYRRPRQLRRGRRSGRRGGAAHRLHPDRRREYLLRRGPDHVRLPGVAALPGGAGGRLHPADDGHQSARGEGERPDLRRADVLLPGDDGPDAGRWLLPGHHRHAAGGDGGGGHSA